MLNLAKCYEYGEGVEEDEECEGDTFSAAAFLIGQPMYLDNVKTAESNASVTSYVAGKRNGILTARVL